MTYGRMQDFLAGLLARARGKVSVDDSGRDIACDYDSDYMNAMKQLLDEVHDFMTLAMDASERIAVQNVCAWEARCHTQSALNLVRAILDDIEQQQATRAAQNDVRSRTPGEVLAPTIYAAWPQRAHL